MPQTPTPFSEPESLAAAEDARDALVAEIQDLDFQLGNYYQEEGHRLEPNAYRRWRAGVVRRRDLRLQTLRQVKAWIRRYHHAREEPQRIGRFEKPPAGVVFGTGNLASGNV